MGAIKILTNVPCLMVTLYDSQFREVCKRYGTQKPMVYVSGNESGLDGFVESIEIPDLKRGLYELRISLPYMNPMPKESGEKGVSFEFPVVMNKLITIREDDAKVIVKFMASLNIE